MEDAGVHFRKSRCIVGVKKNDDDNCDDDDNCNDDGVPMMMTIAMMMILIYIEYYYLQGVHAARWTRRLNQEKRSHSYVLLSENIFNIFKTHKSAFLPLSLSSLTLWDPLNFVSLVLCSQSVPLPTRGIATLYLPRNKLQIFATIDAPCRDNNLLWQLLTTALIHIHYHYH